MGALGSAADGVRAADRKRTEKAALEAKLATLARRVAALPDGVPADAFYSEMKRLHEVGTRLDQELAALGRPDAAPPVVSPTQYERLLGKLKAAAQDADALSPDLKRRAIHALVQEIRVTPSGFRLKFFAGSDE